VAKKNLLNIDDLPRKSDAKIITNRDIDIKR